MPVTCCLDSLPDTPLAGCGANTCALRQSPLRPTLSLAPESMTAGRCAKAPAGGVYSTVQKGRPSAMWARCGKGGP